MVYLDNAATTFPKPRCVIRSVEECLLRYCANPGRSTHQMALECAERVYETREIICDFLSFNHPERVVFTQNATHALNVAILGKVRGKCHIITSDMEHNSVLRPLYSAAIKYGAEISFFDSDLPLEDAIIPLIRSDTSLLVTSIASNVTGKTLDIKKLSMIAKKHGLYTIVDASQYLGHKAIDLSATPFDVLCAPGHKGLFGIQGGGIAVFRNEDDIAPLIMGGSGSNSRSESMPNEYPERLEAGTLNTPAIVALGSGVSYLMSCGMPAIEERLSALTERLYDILNNVNVTLYGCENGIAAFGHATISSAKIAERLDECNIAVRSGLHCAPLIHQKLGCEEAGTVRISLSVFNTQAELDALYKVLREICK